MNNGLITKREMTTLICGTKYLKFDKHITKDAGPFILTNDNAYAEEWGHDQGL
jgi:hypothetical protein